jgi:myo-inositol-1(or 4)-monophosphatase
VKELDVAVGAVREAGAVIRSLYGTALPVFEKGDRGSSPLTEADTRANEIIQRRVMAAFPEDGWLSEESRDSPARLGKRRVWIVDPLDGTKEFVQQIPEFAVCLALAEDGRPIVGVTHNPITGELYTATPTGGASRDGERIAVSSTERLADAVLLASRSESERGEWDRFRGRFTIELSGSVAYKLALVAAGRADATFTLTPKNEWDVCSSVCLIESAGGRVTDLAGAPLRFNQQTTMLSGLVASNGRLHEQILAALGSI